MNIPDFWSTQPPYMHWLIPVSAIVVVLLLVYILIRIKQKFGPKPIYYDTTNATNGALVEPSPIVIRPSLIKRIYKSISEFFIQRKRKKDRNKKAAQLIKERKKRDKESKKRARQEEFERLIEIERQEKQAKKLTKEEKIKLREEERKARKLEEQRIFEEEMKKPFDILGIGNAIKTANDQYISKNLLGHDEIYIEVPVKNIKSITDAAGNFVKLVMNWPGKCFDKDWNIVNLVDENSELLKHPNNRLEPNETLGRRYIGLPGINKCVEYEFSWDTFIDSDKETGKWNIKERKGQKVNSVLCEGLYFMSFGVKTKDGFSVKIGVQFELEVVNGFNAFYGVSTVGRWINKFNTMVFSVFNEFALNKDFKDLKADIASPDNKSDIGYRLQRNESMSIELRESTGHRVKNFDIVPLSWDRNDPMIIAFESIATEKEKRNALKIEIEAKRLDLKYKTDEIKLTEIAKAAGKLEENKSKADLIKKENDAAIELLQRRYEAKEKLVTSILNQEGGDKVAPYIFLGEMENLLSVNMGGEKGDLTLIKNVDEAKKDQKGKGVKKITPKPEEPKN